MLLVVADPEGARGSCPYPAAGGATVLLREDEIKMRFKKDLGQELLSKDIFLMLRTENSQYNHCRTICGLVKSERCSYRVM